MAATFLVDAPVFDHYACIDTTTLLIERSGLFAAYLRPKYVYSNHLLQSAGVAVDELSRQHGFSKSTFYKWKAKYGGLEVSQLKRLKELEDENRKLKEMYAELSLEHKFLKDVLEKKS